MNKIIEHKLNSLKRSKFRSGFKLREKEQTYITERGMDTIREHALDIIRKRIAPAYPLNDGKQTPMKNHPVFIAQHATAVCCRGCIGKWHGFPKGRTLEDDEIHYLTDMIMAWITEQMKPIEITKK